MKVTYVFGAGASSASMPLASQLGEDIGKTANAIRMAIDTDPRNPKDSYGHTIEKAPPAGDYGKALFEDMDWLRSTAATHNTIDTIARKLWMRGDPDSLDELRRLKTTLTAYFWYKQISMPSDRRYDSFFATILQKRDRGPAVLPESVCMLTWNYDLLIERSFYEYCIDYEHTKSHLIDGNKVIHLNGVASPRPSLSDGMLPNDHAQYEADLFYGSDNRQDEVIELHRRCRASSYRDRLGSKITFAWENSEIVEAAREAAVGTEILVVIGYSYPFFNRQQDKTILQTALPSISDIRIQVNGAIGPVERMFSILGQLDPVRDWQAITKVIDDAESIHLPNELIQ